MKLRAYLIILYEHNGDLICDRIPNTYILPSGDAPQLAGVPGRNTAHVLTFVEQVAIKLPLARCRHRQTVSVGSPAMAARAAAPIASPVTACVIMEGLHMTAGVHALLGTKAHAVKHVRYCSVLLVIIIS